MSKSEQNRLTKDSFGQMLWSISMDTAKLFRNGRSQAVRLPNGNKRENETAD